MAVYWAGGGGRNLSGEEEPLIKSQDEDRCHLHVCMHSHTHIHAQIHPHVFYSQTGAVGDPSWS